MARFASEQATEIRAPTAFHRAASFLTYWQQHGWDVTFLTLTSATETPVEELARRHRQLRATLYAEVEWCAGYTSEGNGVVHALWAHPDNVGVGVRNVSRAWPARRVTVDDVGHGEEERLRLAGYITRGQASRFEAFDGSYQRTFGVREPALERAWYLLSARVTDDEQVRLWEDVMGGERVEVRGLVIQPPPDFSFVVDDDDTESSGQSDDDDSVASLGAAIAQASRRHGR